MYVCDALCAEMIICACALYVTSFVLLLGKATFCTGGAISAGSI